MDKWLKTVPDEPKIDIYAKCVTGENNSTVKQAGSVVSGPGQRCLIAKSCRRESQVGTTSVYFPCVVLLVIETAISDYNQKHSRCTVYHTCSECNSCDKVAIKLLMKLL